MHEASLAGGILKLVEDAQGREGFRRVTTLRLAVSRFAGVEVRALRFALEAIAPGTVLQGAALVIDEPPGRAWCLPCGATVALSRRGDPCPRCASHQLQPVGDTELRVLDLLVEDD